MSFSDIATSIVKKSIRSAICIDDEFAEPYEAKNKKRNSQIPKKLYSSFRKDGECSLDFYRYRNWNDWTLKKENVLSNKDLIILDWELESIGNKYANTLKILDDIIQHRTNQFVIIYTHLQYVEEIRININAYFSKNNIQYKDIKIEDFIKVYEDITEDDYKLVDSEIKRLISRDKIFAHEHKLDAIFKSIGIDKKEIGLLMKSIKETFKINNCKDLLEVLLLKAYFLDSHTNNTHRSVKSVNSDKIILNVDNTLILITNKGSTKNPTGILPEKLFKYFTTAITTSPNNSISLMACELKDLFRSNVAIIGNNISNINEKAFFNHWNNLRTVKDITIEEADIQFKFFLIENWLTELSQFTINTTTHHLFFEALRKYAEENGMFNLPEDAINYDDIIKLGAHYSTINIGIEQRTNKKIQFGDIFEMLKIGNQQNLKEVLLSITPHCDSIRPKKIKYLFHFIRGEVITNHEAKQKALLNSEKDHYSFIEIQRIPYCIKWNVKPFTIYVPEVNNDISNSIEVLIQDSKFQLKHLTLLKENYSQRIANYSFSDSMRVGITLPYLKNTPDDE